MKKFNENNLLLDTDSYKYSHFLQYPEGTEAMYDYIEARVGSEYDELVFFGLQMFIKKYLNNPITEADVEEARELATLHGEPFNYEGFMGIVKDHNGYFPIRISALPEGTVIKKNYPIVTVDSTDPKYFWAVSFIETALLRAIWYPTTVATNSYRCKKVIRKFMEKNCDTLDGLLFKLHDFGARGVSSKESAAIGGVAHLVNFMGTDTVMSLVYARNYYDTEMAGFSIPAAEHSTITVYGKENETDAYRNMLRQFAKPGSLVAVVSDSYDIYNACENIWGGTLKQEVIDSGATVVIRPDSGYPPIVVLKCIELLGSKFGYTINTKGYKVLNYVRVIQGDGINRDMIEKILGTLDGNGWSAENVAFGMGGALLQQVNRDTCAFAMKCSAIKVNGEWIDVYKQPVDDSGKVSKRGRVTTYINGDRDYYVGSDMKCKHALMPYYSNGVANPKWCNQTLDEIRERSNNG